jgi:hypothetical protein
MTTVEEVLAATQEDIEVEPVAPPPPLPAQVSARAGAA